MGFPRFSAGRRGLRTALARGSLAALALAISAVVLSSKLGDVEISTVASALTSIPPAAWLLAVLASAASFLAVGQYDALFHGWLGTGIRQGRAAVSGAASIALAQFLGFGLVTGTLARWRALPEISLSDALRITHYVTFSFVAALGTLSAAASYLSGLGVPGTGLFFGLAIVVTLAAAGLSLLPQGRLPFAIPPLRVISQSLALTALDTGSAALALWVLLPPDLAVSVFQLFAAFLVSLAAGTISGTPGGIGPFEVLMIALMPQVPEPELIASILAFRVVYHALPACFAVLVLARPGSPQVSNAPTGQRAGPVRRAEAGLAHLPGHRLDGLDAVTVITAQAGPSLVAIGDPVCGNCLGANDLAALERIAWARGYWPTLYKAGARSAVTARRLGWRVAAIAEEAWINTVGFSEGGPGRRQLRRKRRQAEAAGIVIATSADLPFEDMARVANEWARRSGGERGFSMGLFDRRYIERQRTYLAWQDNRLVAFCTFHVAPHEWTLDLMRSANDAPNGTMHALITHAIGDAARNEVSRLSLAAMPLSAATGPVALFSRRPEATGLRRFKQSFAPRRETLYIAAPNTAALALAAIGILLSVLFPAGSSIGMRKIFPESKDGGRASLKACAKSNAALQQCGLSDANNTPKLAVLDMGSGTE